MQLRMLHSCRRSWFEQPTNIWWNVKLCNASLCFYVLFILPLSWSKFLINSLSFQLMKCNFAFRRSHREHRCSLFNIQWIPKGRERTDSQNSTFVIWNVLDTKQYSFDVTAWCIFDVDTVAVFKCSTKCFLASWCWQYLSDWCCDTDGLLNC